jgi:hypothetical protein
VVAVIGSFWIASSGVIDAATAYRNAEYGTRPLASSFADTYGGTTVNSLAGAAHPFWHTFYIALGFDRNRYGIYYGDSSAFNYVAGVRPDVKPLSSQYGAILEKRYFHILGTDPGFVIGTYFHKAGVTLDLAVRDSWPVLVLLPLVLLVAGRRRHIRAWLALFVPPLLVLLAVPTAVAPLHGYQYGFLNGVRVLLVVLLCWIAAEVEQAVRRLSAARQATWRDYIRGRFLAPYLSVAGPVHLRPEIARDRGWLLRPSGRLLDSLTHLREAIPRRLALVTAAVVLLEAVAWIGASTVAAHEHDSVTYPNGQPEKNQIVSQAGVLRWQATAAGLPAWGPANGARQLVNADSAGRTVMVRTTATRYAYELAGPTVTLPGGAYQLWVNGSARKGGSMLVAFDADTDAVVASRTYGPASASDSGWGLTFTLNTSRNVRFVLANAGGAGLWTIRSIELGRAPQGVGDTRAWTCQHVGPPVGAINATPPTIIPAAGTPVHTWMPPQLLDSWIPRFGPRASIRGTTLVVHTTASRYSWELVSPILDVNAGRYLLRVKGSIATGGLMLIAVVPGTQIIIAKRLYGPSLPRAGPVSMALPFAVDGAQAIQYVLANSTPTGSPATVWKIEQVALARQR